MTRMKSGMMTPDKKMLRVALFNSNTMNVNSPTHGSRPDYVYMVTNNGGTCKA